MGVCGDGGVWRWGCVEMGVCGDGGVWRWGCVEMGVCVNKDVCVCVCVCVCELCGGYSDTAYCTIRKS